MGDFVDRFGIRLGRMVAHLKSEGAKGHRAPGPNRPALRAEGNVVVVFDSAAHGRIITAFARRRKP